MAKAHSPIRLQKALMEAAAVSGSTQHRSAAEQIEYWADIGRRVSKVVDTDTLLALQAGLVRLSVDRNPRVTLDADDLMQGVAERSASGALSKDIADGQIRYQASNAHPGLLEQVQADGSVILGSFCDGQFEARDG